MSTPSLNSQNDKVAFDHKEDVAAVSSLEANGWDKEFEKKTIAKVDRRLLIILGAIYAISLIDRTNISIARVAGMGKALQLTVGERYSIITCVFFPPYILFELPMNMLLRKIGARIHLSGITLAWGVVMLGMGFITNWHQLLICRILLGFFESGFFPGCVYLIQCWYTRYETQKRLAAFYLTSMVISGFSNILGYGISKLGGAHGIAAWRWIFIVFGAATLGLGIMGAFLISDFPDKNKFLTAEQTRFVQERIELDRGDSQPDQLTLSKAGKYLSDFKLWVVALCFCFTTMPVYAFSYFLPVILAGGGYSTELSLILSAPPYVFAAILTMAIAYSADKTRQRAVFIGVNAIVCLVGLCVMAWGGKIGVRYFGAFLAIGGAQANIPTILAYSANNVRNQSKRAVSSAMVIGGGGVGGIFASLAYRQKDSPRYLPGLGATMGCQGAIILMLIAQTLAFKRANAKADRDGTEIEGSKDFRYTL